MVKGVNKQSIKLSEILSPGGRIGKACQAITEKLHGKHRNDQSGNQFSNASHHGEKAISAALHDISEDKDRAERKKEEGTHVTVSGSPWYHGIHIYISGEEQMETRFQK